MTLTTRRERTERLAVWVYCCWEYRWWRRSSRPIARPGSIPWSRLGR